MRARNCVIITLLIFILSGLGILNNSFADEKLVITPPPSENAIMYESLDITVNDEDGPVIVTVTNTITGNSVSMTLLEDPIGSRNHNGKIAINNQALVDADLDDEVIANINVSSNTVLRVSFGTEFKEITVVIAGQVTPTGTRHTVTQKLYDVLNCGFDANGDEIPEEDIDKDHICDDWETGNVLRITNAGNTYEYFCDGPNADDLTPHPRPCSNQVPDIFLEIDWMEGHKPDPRAIEEIVTAFDRRGVNLHIQIDETYAIKHDPEIGFPGYDFESMPHYKGFDQIKGDQFGTDDERTTYGVKTSTPNQGALIDEIRTLKHQVFHYSLFNHARQWYAGQSGVAEINGNDFMISMWGFTGNVGSKDQQAGTLMHELGHNLGLNHGGGDAINNKPNYFSVMTYSRQFTDYDPNRLLDFSEQALGHTHTPGYLDETNLIENNPSGFGLEAYPGHENEVIIYSCGWGGPPAVLFRLPGTPVNWDCDSFWDRDPPVENNINNLPEAPSPNPPSEILWGYDDWANLHYNFSDYSDYADGIHENNGNGIAGGYNNAAREPERGVPPGESRASIALAAQNFGRPTLSTPDLGFTYVSQVEELTVKDMIKSRIAAILALRAGLHMTPEPEFHEISFDESLNSTPEIIYTQAMGPTTELPPIPLLPNQFTQNTLERYVGEKAPPNLSIKELYLWGTEKAIEQTNHHDIKRTKFIIQLIDLGLKVTLDDEEYDRISPTINNLIASYDRALDFIKTDIHSEDHKRVSEPIVDPDEVALMIDAVDREVTGDSDCDGIPDLQDETPFSTPPGCGPETEPTHKPSCPVGTTRIGEECVSINGPPFWLWVILVGIFIAIGISAWLGNRSP